MTLAIAIILTASLLVSMGYMFCLWTHSRNRRAGRIVRRAYFMDESRPLVEHGPVKRAAFLK